MIMNNKSLDNTLKLDGMGPIDKRPSTDKLHHFDFFVEEKKCDTWHPPPDTWHLTPETWQLIANTWHLKYDTWVGLVGGNIQLPSSYGLW